MPIVARLSISPVKSLALLHPDGILLTKEGVAEDRRFYLVDDTGRLIDGLVVGALVQVGAWTDPDGETLRLTMPDGRVIEDVVAPGEPIATQMYGRTAMSHVVEGPWAEALAELVGRRLRIARVDRPGGTRTHNQASIVSDGSLGRLGDRFGAGAVDGRRFRMLIELSGADEHEEDGWIGRRIGIGEAVLSVTKPDARCAITTHDPDTGARDLDTLRAIREYRGLRDGKNLDFGVLADVARPGRIRLGDAVHVNP
ncbi:MAG TPA: MOSC N-terminal beta barrel domain-containing protein [Candidatus Limnocylindrales bacterium]|nr:MOSC N-terminal beta barrel domain-containing protein [Candidatus Limnocylindrales bacterium]